jgi:hypothetical protein
MKKTTPNKLSNQLANYGALSLAIMGLADANGQIIYTDVNPDVGGPNVDYQLDLNNDGTVDFTIYNYVISGTDRSSLAILPDIGNSILGISSTTSVSSDFWVYPFALDSGEIISGGKTSWQSFYVQDLNYSDCGIRGSQWCGVTDKYLGLRFHVSGNTYYGWARLDVALDQSNWVIKDYAYNSGLAEGRVRAEGASILAGEGGPLGIDDNVFSKVKITALNKTIALSNLPQTTNYRLFSLAGKSVLDGKIVGSTQVIEANTLSNGVYIIELKDENSKGIIRKKIVL